MSPEPTRIILRMSGVAKLVYVVTVVASFGFVILSIGVLLIDYDRITALNIGPLLLGIVFFGGGALLISRLLIKEGGYLEIRDEGMLFDTYLFGGLVPWNKVTAVGSVRALGVKYLGIAVDGIESCLASKAQGPMSRYRDRKLTQGFNRIMFTFAPTIVLNKIFYIMGYTKFPDSPTEVDLLKWNKENFGYEILIHGFWIQNMKETVAAISQRI